MRCRDFFVHLNKDAASDHWEFDHATWAGIAAEPLRYRICASAGGAKILSGCVDVDTDEIVWMELETEATLELAMLNVVDRVFSDAGGFERSGSRESSDDSLYQDRDCLDLAVMDTRADPDSTQPVRLHCSRYTARRSRKLRLTPSNQGWATGS